MALTKIDDRGLKTPIDLLDNEKIRFGTGNDLEIYHNGTNSIIDNNTGSLQITAASFRVNNAANNEVQIKAVENSGVELFYDDTTKLSTTNSGVNITNGTSEALLQVIGGENQKGELRLVADDGDDNADKWSFQARTDGNLNIQNYNGGSWVNSAVFQGGGAANLYYDNSKKFETNAYGTITTGHSYLFDNYKLQLGSSQDLQIYHDGTDSFIHGTTGTRQLKIRGQEIRVVNEANSEIQAKFIENGSVELYYDGNRRAYTSSDGLRLDDNLRLEDNKQIRLGTGEDLLIWHQTSSDHGYIRNLTGDLYIQGNNSGTTVNSVVATSNGAVELYYNNSKKLETRTDGAEVVGYMAAGPSGSSPGTGSSHDFRNELTNNWAMGIRHNTTGDPYGLWIGYQNTAPDDSSHQFIQCDDSGNTRFIVYSDGDVQNHDNSYGSISDVKLKENIVDAESQWEDIKAIKVRNFNFKTNKSKKLLGVVAQELETTSPGLVVETADKDSDLNDLGTTTKSVRYSILYMKAIKALQEAITKIETLETKVAALESN